MDKSLPKRDTMVLNIAPSLPKLRQRTAADDFDSPYVASQSELATAMIRVKIDVGMSQPIRVLCDSGSQVNLITKTCAKRIGLTLRPADCRMRGYDGIISQKAKGMSTMQVCNRFSDDVIFHTEVYVVTSLPDHIPSRPIETVENEDEYADQQWNVPGPVEALLGAGAWAKIIAPDIEELPNGMMRHGSKLGYLIFGDHLSNSDISACSAAITNDADASIFTMVEKLWESERYDDPKPITSADAWCQQNFVDTYSRDPDGRYIVTIPIDPAAGPLGESRRSALQQFYSLEGRMKKDPELAAKYIEFMREYEQLGHMIEVDPKLDRGGPTYHIPHHAVRRKFRVVFNASAPTTNGKSLNSIQFVGPRLQADITDIITNFRRGAIAFCADIKKMYRQIAIHPSQWNYQRIFWRESPSHPLKEYWLVVVTYGMTASGYNAVRALQQCAADHANEHPRGAEIVNTSFYVDDLLASADTVQDAIFLKEDTTALLAKGCFELSKWISNESALLEPTSADEKLLSDAENPSVLGLKWDPKQDDLMINVQRRSQPPRLTKRQLVGECARIYDPLVFLAPVTIIAKRFIKEVWAANISWDDSIPEEMQTRWDAYYDSLDWLAHLRIPRWVGCGPSSTSQLHIFADASEIAMGAVAYLVVRNGDTISINVLMSINRLAPKSAITIPRMELSAAVLAVQLNNKLRGIELCKGVDTFFWTDSEITLQWLHKEPAQMKVFVANRVAKIQRSTNIERWGHVRSANNPADLLSRGIAAHELLTADLWWHGPSFLSNPQYVWTPWQAVPNEQQKVQLDAETRPTARDPITATLVYKTKPHRQEADILGRSRSLRHLLDVTVRVIQISRRWLRRVKGHSMTSATLKALPGGDCIDECITSEQKDVALKFWVRQVQLTDFADEYDALDKKQALRKDSRLRADAPCLIDGIMRVWGRLDNMETEFDTKHPMIIDGKSHLATLLIADAHRKVSHGTAAMTRVYLRARFHIIGARVAVRKHCSSCLICARFNAKVPTQMMSDLPAVRVNPAKAFYNTGVDYAGPFMIKRGRGQATQKVYIAIFVCMTTKALHTEVVTDASSDAFLAALDRFVAVRAGQIRHIYSDNGRNFVGAERQLREAIESWDSPEMAERAVNHGITWHFNTPINPHAGGLWERGVQSVKTHLNRMGGITSYTYEEAITLLARVTMCLNSRPICSMSDDPNDMTVLTPGHFLVGGPMIQPWAPDYGHIPENRLASWQRLHSIQQQFWKRWSDEYILELQRRSKWLAPKRNMQVGDFVLLRNEASPPAEWLKGRISEVFPGPDGLVRSVMVRTEHTSFKRPIGQLCYLPVDTTLCDIPRVERPPITRAKPNVAKVANDAMNDIDDAIAADSALDVPDNPLDEIDATARNTHQTGADAAANVAANKRPRRACRRD